MDQTQNIDAPLGSARASNVNETQDIGQLNEYLVQSCTSILNLNKDKLYHSLHKQETQDIIYQFVQDKNLRILLVSKVDQSSKTAQKEEEQKSVDLQKQNSEIDTGDNDEIRFSLQVKYMGPIAHTIAFLKRESFAVLDLRVTNQESNIKGENLAKQLQLINVGFVGEDFNIFELAATYVEYSLVPLFNSYKTVKSTGADKSGSTSAGFENIQKNLQQLKAHLVQCQQNIIVPQIELQHEPEIKEKYDQVKLLGRELETEDFADRSSDPSFVAKLEKTVFQWVKDIRRITKLNHDPQQGSALLEMNFWLAIESSLTNIEEQLKNNMIEVTLNVLKQSGKMNLVYQFKLDTELDTKLKQARDYNKLLRDFPINQLLSSNTLDQVATSIDLIFNQFKLIKQAGGDHYPNQRAVLLVNAVCQDLNDQMLKILSQVQIMYLEYAEFEILKRDIQKVFNVLLENINKFREIVNVNRSRVDPQTAKVMDQIMKNNLQVRLERIFLFRKHHDKFKQIIQETLSKEANSDLGEVALAKIHEAYQVFNTINVLDITKEGFEIWEQTERAFNQKIDKVESQITTILKDKLSAAQNASEMFRVFRIFNALITRPRIRGAIQEYQIQLLLKVEQDIDALQNKLLNNQSLESHPSQSINRIRGFPEYSNKITWTQQIERKLKIYLQRVEDVLGSNWQDLHQGKKLKQMGDNFLKALQTRQEHYQNTWLEAIKKIDGAAEKSKSVFNIEQRIDRFHFFLDFNPLLWNLPQELNQLKILLKKMPLSITLKSSDVQLIYPLFTMLNESLRTFEYTESRVTHKFSKLVAEIRIQAQQQMLKGMTIQWKSNVLDKYSKELRKVVTEYEEAVNDVNVQIQNIEKHLEELQTCPMSQEGLAQVIEKIQKIIDVFEIQSYSNLQIWVDELDIRISDILCDRLEKRVSGWIQDFCRGTDDSKERSAVQINVLKIKMSNQNFILEPSLAETRSYLYTQLHEQVESICGLKRIQAQRFVGYKGPQREKTYMSLVKKMKNYNITNAYTSLEGILHQAEQYFLIWKQYQALWDLQSGQIYDMLAEDVEKWTQLLNEIRVGRKTFETSDDRKQFGALVINYGGVKSEVNNKYDMWHKEILNKFGTKLKGTMREFYTEIQGARRRLEGLSIDASDDVTIFVTEIQEIKRNVQGWEKSLEKQKRGQKLLVSQRYQFPNDWLWIDIIEFEWSQSFQQILAKKTALMNDQIPLLQAKIMQEEKSVNSKIKEIEEQWEKNRPRSSDFTPKDALDILNIIGKKLTTVNQEWTRICKAQELLDMELGDSQRLSGVVEDHALLKSVWQEVSKVWSQIDEINSTPLSAYVYKKVKEILDKLLEQMNDFPNKLRAHNVYDEYKAQLQKYRKVNAIFLELKGEAMKNRHWKNLLQKLKIKVNFNDLTLGNLWDADLMKNNKVVNEIMAEARGELILEDFIRSIKDCWAKYELELIRYQNKCRLIKGWDELFTQIDEHINNIQSMKMSPYYKVFEEEIVPWDDKLQKIRLIFDNWIDVQRRYVYLEGIFFGSADIKSMLTAEFNKFKGIDQEFTTLMKKVVQKPQVLEVMSIQNLGQNLERYADMLSKIQKALGDYLEKQRQSFARFYFVGDEDLLEIIGNSKEVRMVQRHFPKMFAGITVMNFEKEGDQLNGMYSREGEYVEFSKSFLISEDPTIAVWLTKVESSMQIALANKLLKSIEEMQTIDLEESPDDFNKWIETFPAQIDILSMQVSWSQRVEECLKKGAASKTLLLVEKRIFSCLEMMAERVLTDLAKDIRQKYEQLITDLVHQREVTRQLINDEISSITEFAWLYHMRFYFNHKQKNALEQLQIQVANGDFFYGFEYLGVGEKLVQTPLTDKCYLTLTQALHWRLGGSPFGPAGTGKTESVKALGSQLGRYVLVFNCDETFDGNAMGRIFVGLCQVGAWGCFDEFNRLEERMLSAVSQQILLIQMGLKAQSKKIDLMGRDVKLNEAMGIFITMNPNYAGRSNLPDNLKQLFRQIAMVQPNKEMIARVKLYSQGFKTSEKLSGKIVSLFDLCLNQLSSQSHYDFGLRALKSVLVSAGNLKRSEKAKLTNPETEIDAAWEQNILLRSLCDTLVPKLIAQDIPLLESLLSGVFPGSSLIQIREQTIREGIDFLKSKYNILANDQFVEKVLQLYQILNLHHGVMMVGPTGVGKTAAWKILLETMERKDGIKGEAYIIDPKAINKDELYGRLDSTTAEWTDGVFTLILRKVIDNHRGESQKRHWLIFDGDVDPEWAENLNSVLDDNKLLTLPSGERLQIPENVRIMFEVETLKYATLATVSRCGMVWFSNDTVSLEMMYHHYLCRLKQDDFDALGESPEEPNKDESKPQQTISYSNKEERQTREACVNSITNLFMDSESVTFITKLMHLAAKQPHIMEFTNIRGLEAFFALVRRGITNIIEYNSNHSDFPLSETQIAAYMTKWVVFSAVWGIGGSMNLQIRTEFSEEIRELVCGLVDMPPSGQASVLDYEVRIDDQQWHLWKKRVPLVPIDPSKVTDASTVINTVDTTRHQEVLCSWLSEHRPFLLCGPPGSGKTMTLMATLKMLTDMEMIFINFSSSTKPELILKTFDHYCEYKKTPQGIVLRPRQLDKWLVVFCDEINLPDEDKYGTQIVIAFLREITEQKGFWRSSDKQFVKLERIQFVGACNPPTDAGRHPLSERFLRHAPLIYIDFPGPDSLKQIYGTFNQAMLSRLPAIKSHSEALTEAMVEFYTTSQYHFTADMQPHYIYSPRELTRWKYAIFEALKAVEDVEDLVRLYVHEGLRLFEDRLVYPEEKVWCNETIDKVAKKWFPSIDTDKALHRPILFSNYTKQNYVSVSQEELKVYIEGRLKTFYEEELAVQLVVFDSVIDHILRIDRVLKQPLGHLLLVGASGVGKTTLTRFVSWINNLTVFQIKAGRNYSVYDFDEDLRQVMKRAGCKSEKICFIFDESNVLSSAFLERMNALLASGEVPGLFDGDEYTALINQCKEASLRDGKIIDTEDELYKHFIYQVQRNLHVVFTMNPSNPDFSNRTASSPALFNRCVIDWFGDWSDDGLMQVATSLMEMIEVPSDSFQSNVDINESTREVNDKKIDPKTELLSQAIVNMHITVRDLNLKLARSAKKFNYITPRDFLDFIRHFVDLKQNKKSELVELQGHLNRGLDKLKESEDEVKKLQATLTIYQKELQEKEKIASEKMNSIVTEKVTSTKQKEISEQTAKQLIVKQKEIAERKVKVDSDLGKAEPALLAAKQSVEGVKKKDLDEIRNYPKPPEPVRNTLEPVIALLTKSTKAADWNTIKQKIKEDTFIKSVTDFNKDDIPNNVKTFISREYLQNKDKFDTEKIMKASKAAGPLAVWLEALITYSEIFHSIAPLRAELNELEQEESRMVNEKNALDDKIASLEVSIKSLEDEYGALIAQVQNIKSDMIQVKEKVERSVSLIRNLSSERQRWENSSKDFVNQMACLVGDCLFASAYLTYIGFFDFFYRKQLQTDWRDSIDQVQLKQRYDMKFTEFLSKPSDRLNWEKEGLPNDELCTENAIIMMNFNRYPLVIDPSDQALKFILNHFQGKKIQKTSFADESFMKNLETAIRFGLPLLVQDVERIDPVLNSVLNKEVYSQGGRKLIRVGDQEIDYSNDFILYMVTRDPNANFTPDLCSRVTFVNFTVTPSSLQSQCLNIFLKEERPDIEKRRNDIIKLQGEFRVKLRHLEDQLLNELNESEGNILQNNKLIKTLETLQNEAKEVANQVAQADETMKEVEKVAEEYEPIANMASRIFFSLDSLSSIHFLYQFSLQQFMFTLYQVINNSEKLNKIPKTNYEMRRQVLTQEFFDKTYEATARGLLVDHQILFALRLVQIRKANDEKFERIFAIFMRSPTLLDTRLPQSLLQGRLTKAQLISIQELDALNEFKGLIDDFTSNEEQWLLFLDHPTAEQVVPEPWKQFQTDLSRETSQAMRMIVLKVLRPDRLLSSAKQLITLTLSEESFNQVTSDLDRIVENESVASRPFLLVSAPGYDASFMIDKLAQQKKKKYTSVAIGSPEAFDEAESAIKLAARSGSWVLLKNVHLAPSWLVELEKTIYKLNLEPNFRLFLTMEVNPKVPSTLIRSSYVLMFEPPSGIKAAMLRSYSQSISKERSDAKPVQRAKLHFIAAWFNAVVQERLRYIPIGWSKVYEFNQSDQRCVLDCIDEWLDSMGKGREVVDPDKIPWDALRALVSQSIFGGKIDNDFDHKILQSLVNYFFCKETFNYAYKLYDSIESDGSDVLTIPDAKSYPEFLDWVKQLPQIESPAWSGLPLNVEKLNRMKAAEILLVNLKMIQGTGEEELNQTAVEAANSDGKAQWLVQLQKKLQDYMQMLPRELQTLKRVGALVKNPLFRFLERECSVLSALLKRLHNDFELVLEVCNGERKSTNQLKTLAQNLHADIIPSHWRKYTIPDGITASEWLRDFVRRVEQLKLLSQSTDHGRSGIWFGGLLMPEAYLIATQQSTAQQNGLSLEELELKFEFNPSDDEKAQTFEQQDGFIITGLAMESGEYNSEDKRIKMTNKLSSQIPTIILRWVKKVKELEEDKDKKVEIPVYLNQSRKQLLCAVKIGTYGVPANSWYQRGVAMFASAQI